jgi:hypothetical protein
MTDTPRDRWYWTLMVFAWINLANAVWMLADPKLWYTDLPAAVPDFGPYNEHFVRDLGFVFLSLALALWWAARRPAFRLPLVTVTTLFYVFHAAGHVFDTARGFVDASHWWVDVPAVYAPALFLIGLNLALFRAPHPETHPQRT